MWSGEILNQKHVLVPTDAPRNFNARDSGFLPSQSRFQLDEMRGKGVEAERGRCLLASGRQQTRRATIEARNETISGPPLPPQITAQVQDTCGYFRRLLQQHQL